MERKCSTKWWNMSAPPGRTELAGQSMRGRPTILILGPLDPRRHPANLGVALGGDSHVVLHKSVAFENPGRANLRAAVAGSPEIDRERGSSRRPEPIAFQIRPSGGRLMFSPPVPRQGPGDIRESIRDAARRIGEILGRPFPVRRAHFRASM